MKPSVATTAITATTETITTIDAHLHIWDLQRLHYHWLSPDDKVLYRDVTPQEVEALMTTNHVQAALLVEAANLTQEIAYLCEVADAYTWVAGVIGWASVDDMPTPQDAQRMKGVRLPWLHTEADAVIPSIVREYGLPCDMIAGAEAYHVALTMAESAPELTFIVAHFGLPKMAAGGAAAWAERLKPLAQQPNVVMKLSGHLTSAESKPLAVDILREYVDAAVGLFGADRLMYGSNYPISLWAGTYAEDIRLMREATAGLGLEAQAAIFNRTAQRIYRL